MRYTIIKLKPCPFCGGKGAIMPKHLRMPLPHYQVQCQNPDCKAGIALEGYYGFSEMETAVARWNRRPKSFWRR